MRRLHAICLLVLPCLASLAACDSNPTYEGARSADERALTSEQLLGKRLFEDTSLSEPAGLACASCHEAALAFTGNHGSPVPAVALGSRPDQLGGRNAPSVMYAMFSPSFAFVPDANEDGTGTVTATGGQFWDGRAVDLEHQAEGPLLNPREMNNASRAAVVDKLRRGKHATFFVGLYGPEIFDDVDGAYEQAAAAIAAFERSSRFAPFSSKFDQVLRGKDRFSDEEARGFALFKDPEKGNCLACHVGDPASHEPADWLFTDFTYDALGAPRNPALPDNGDPTSFDLGLCAQKGIEATAPGHLDLGTLCGAFKVPSLRNIAVTAPYFHNGVFTELRDVVRFYATRDTDPSAWYPTDVDGTVHKFNDLPAAYHANVNTREVPYGQLGQPPRLDDGEIDAVVAFLQTLTDR
jgi:cytochrome c peroxidase